MSTARATRPAAHPTGVEAQVEDVRAALSTFFRDDRQIEIRAPQSRNQGRVTNQVLRFGAGAYEAAAKAAVRLSGKAPAVYIVLNGVKSNLPQTTKGASAADVPGRQWILFDIDPKRPKDSNSTDSEKAAAHAVAIKIREYLIGRGWPEPVLADSGNGYHLLFSVDLPADDVFEEGKPRRDGPTTELVKRLLQSLAAMFNTDECKVDEVVYDLPRLCKLYGTLACKGDPTDERPARLARILSTPDHVVPLSRGLIQSFVDDTVSQANGDSASLFDLEADIERKRVQSANGDGAAERPSGMGFTATNNRPDAETRAVAYLARCEPAISGQAGHNKAFKAACKVGPGFDLTEEQAFRILWEHYNPRCEPRWSDRELRHKVSDAYKNETRRGWLLNAERNGANGHGNGRPTFGGRANVPPPGSPKAKVASVPNDLPFIVCGSDDPSEGLKTWTPAALDALAKANQPPRIFQRGAKLVRIRPADEDSPPLIENLTLDALRGEMDLTAYWGTECHTKQGPRVKYGPPRLDVVRDVFARPGWDEKIAPGLETVVESPRFMPDGRLILEPGYHPDAKLIYSPPPELRGLAVPETPTAAEVDWARSLILDDLLYDFTFANQPSRAGAVALTLLPAVRLMIKGPTPLHHVTASTEGTGKTLLVTVCTYPFLGREIETNAQKENEAEWRKALTSTFMSGASHYLIDNMYNPPGWDDVPMPVDSGTLAMALTSAFYKDRILGGNDEARIKIQTIFASTGNNTMFSRELTRRVVPIELVAPIENPSLRTGFKHNPLLGDFVVPRRADLLKACLIIVRHWIAIGRPAGEEIMGRYEEYARIMGGILGSIGVEGFLCNRVKLIGRNNESKRWVALINAWHTRHQTAQVTAGELWTSTIQTNSDLQIAFADILGDKSELSQKQRLGKKLESQVNQIWGDWRISLCSHKARNGTNVYRLKPASDPIDEGVETPIETGDEGSHDDFTPF